MGMSGRLLRPKTSGPIGAPTVPGAPVFSVDLFAVAGNAQMELLWASPASNGGAPITDYVVQFSTDGGLTWNTFADGISTLTSATVTGLTNGTGHLFRVAAVNSAGTGPYEWTPNTRTPVAPVIAPSLWKVETYSPVYHWSI